MLSITYNCPKVNLIIQMVFDGLSLDETNVATHKNFSICWIRTFKTYSVHDILKEIWILNKELAKFEDS